MYSCVTLSLSLSLGWNRYTHCVKSERYHQLVYAILNMRMCDSHTERIERSEWNVVACNVVMTLSLCNTKWILYLNLVFIKIKQNTSLIIIGLKSMFLGTPFSNVHNVMFPVCIHWNGLMRVSEQNDDCHLLLLPITMRLACSCASNIRIRNSFSWHCNDFIIPSTIWCEDFKRW